MSSGVHERSDEIADVPSLLFEFRATSETRTIKEIESTMLPQAKQHLEA
jgi:hypothetical protein